MIWDIIHGDGNILYEAISFEDRLIGQIYDAVKEREAKVRKDWLFICNNGSRKNCK